jgi:hypothetical protein
MRFVIAGFVSLTLSAYAFASPSIIQPDESAATDSFVYEFLPNTNFDGPGFNGILSSGRSVNPGHDTRSFLRFDFSGDALAAGEAATLNLFVVSGASVGFPFVDPSPGAPVSTELRYLTGGWDESTVSWNQQPAIGTIVIDTQTIDGVGQWVRFDITALVSAWIGDPSLNFGLAIQQVASVNNGGAVFAVYESASGVHRPYVQIVPEPAGVSLLLAALTACRRRSNA